MRVVSLTGATSVVDPEHGEHHAGPDGVFDLPHPFAEHLTRTAAGMWRGEADHLSRLARESHDELLDPRVALRVLSELRERIGGLETRVAELEAPQATADNEEESEPQDNGDGEDEESEQESEDATEEDSGDELEAAEMPAVTKPTAVAKKTTARRTTAKSRA